MERLTEEHPSWINDEFWTAAREPDDEEITDVYLRLKAYEDTGLAPEEVLTGVELAEICAGMLTLAQYQFIGTVEEFRALKDAEQKRREGCEFCRPDRDGYVKTLGGFAIHNGKLCVKGLKPREINQCFMCGRELRGESHDGT